MGDVEVHTEGGDEGDTAAVYQRAEAAQEREGRVRAFVAALRSGQWEQTRGVLHRPEPKGDRPAGFCCLGVACEVAIAAGVQLLKGPSGPSMAYVTEARVDMCDRPGCTNHDVLEKDVANLPSLLVCWYGLDSKDPELRVPREVMEQASLDFGNVWNSGATFLATTLNDAAWARFTFAMIADCFEYTFLPQDWEAAHAQS